MGEEVSLGMGFEEVSRAHAVPSFFLPVDRIQTLRYCSSAIPTCLLPYPARGSHGFYPLEPQ